MACPEELMIPQYQEDLGKMITLPLKEFEVRLIVCQARPMSPARIKYGASAGISKSPYCRPTSRCRSDMI